MPSINSCPVFIVNLDNAPARMKSMDKQCKDMDIAYQRISAVKGVDLSIDEVNIEYSKELNKKHFRYDLSLGEIGCYMSHRKIWRKMVEEKIEFAVVLEDDLIIQKNFSNMFSSINSLKDYELIKLADNRDYASIDSKEIDKNNELINYKKIPNCTTGYTINLDAAIKLLSREKFYRPVDIDMQFCRELHLSVYGLRPYPIIENSSFESDIVTLNGGLHDTNTTTFFRNLKYRLSLWCLRKFYISGAL